jgi:hypothetical protein
VEQAHEFRIVNNHSVVEQAHEFQLIVRELEQLGHVLPDDKLVAGGIVAKLPSTWRNFVTALKHKRQKMSIEDLLASLYVEENTRAKDASPRAHEGQSSANVMQQAGKNKQKSNQTTQFKKKKMNMDEVVCFLCSEIEHFNKKCKNCKGKKN